MATDHPIETPPHIVAVAVAVFLLAVWAASFSHSCRSDGCIGIVFPAAGAAAALAVQLLVLLPQYMLSRKRAGRPFGRTAAAWAAISVAVFVVPMLFVK